VKEMQCKKKVQKGKKKQPQKRKKGMEVCHSEPAPTNTP
jgi:hypothetical protein